MRFYDISVPLTNDMPTYPGDPGIQINDWFTLAKGDPANLTRLNLGAHTGTHVDAPAHFIEGAAPVESLALDTLIGKAQVLAVPETSLSIDKTLIAEQLKPDISRLLFRTRNSSFWHN